MNEFEIEPVHEFEIEPVPEFEIEPVRFYFKKELYFCGIRITIEIAL